MSNLAAAGHLRRAASQLPVSWYCDPAVFDAFEKTIDGFREIRLRLSDEDDGTTLCKALLPPPPSPVKAVRADDRTRT